MEGNPVVGVEAVEISLLFEKQWADPVSCMEFPQTLEKKPNPSDDLMSSYWVSFPNNPKNHKQLCFFPCVSVPPPVTLFLYLKTYHLEIQSQYFFFLLI